MKEELSLEYEERIDGRGALFYTHSKDIFKERSVGLDVIRVLAIFFVIGGHFFLNTPGLNVVFEGPSLFIQGMAQTLFLINVPLFLLLTGYLNLNKRINRVYYKRMAGVLLSYVFISVVTILFKIYYLGENITFYKGILEISGFTAISYAWYIEMWIGLYLLTPFLNILWKNIDTKKHKLILIATLYLLCAFPDFFNRYGVKLVPGYWELMYPCAFYFIGAYIKDYQPKVKTSILISFVIGCCLINPVFNFLFVKNHSMIHLVGDGNGIIGMPLAAAVFLLFYQVKISNKILCSVLAGISVVSLDMYLSSYMFDLVFYRWFKENFYINQGQFGPWFFVIVPLVFVSAYVFSVFKKYLFHFLHLPSK